MESTETQKNMSLYGIVTEAEALSNRLEELGGELTPELEELSKEVAALLLKKTDMVVGYARSIDDMIDVVKKRRKEIQELEKKLEGRLYRFKEYVKFCMKKTGEKKIETPFSRMTLIKPRHVVVIDDESKLDQDRYVRTEKVINKSLIMEDIKLGREVQGASLRVGEEGISLVFK